MPSRTPATDTIRGLSGVSGTRKMLIVGLRSTVPGSLRSTVYGLPTLVYGIGWLRLADESCAPSRARPTRMI